MLRSIGFLGSGTAKKHSAWRNRHAAGLSVTSGLLVVMVPKCPMCFAGYSALLAAWVRKRFT